ncbi:MAG TPA: sigma-70 family RNA polymerase sigma factor, partial [Halomonas sp.]|nr:sigma-70 family RNA polymerase sigma factor [Halomonas sp.]
VKPEIVRDMEGRLSSYDAGFDGSANDDEESTYQAPVHFLDDAASDPATQLEDSNFEEDSTRRLQLALEGLDERSRDILQRRWLADSKETLHDLADVYGVSAERIRQLEKNAMKKLRLKMGEAMVA